MSDKIKKIINISSIIIMIITFLLTLLLPMPYDGVNPVVFMLNGQINIPALILFIFFMLCVEGFSFLINKLTTIKTYDDIQRDVLSWSKYGNLEKIHPAIAPFVEMVKSAKDLDKKEAKEKIKEQAQAIKVQTEIEMLSSANSNEFKKYMQDFEKTKNENAKLKEKLELYEKIEKEALENEK